MLDIGLFGYIWDGFEQIPSYLFLFSLSLEHFLGYYATSQTIRLGLRQTPFFFSSFFFSPEASQAISHPWGQRRHRKDCDQSPRLRHETVHTHTLRAALTDILLLLERSQGWLHLSDPFHRLTQRRLNQISVLPRTRYNGGTRCYWYTLGPWHRCVCVWVVCSSRWNDISEGRMRNNMIPGCLVASGIGPVFD